MCVFAKQREVGKKAGDWKKRHEEQTIVYIFFVVYKNVNIGHI